MQKLILFFITALFCLGCTEKSDTNKDTEKKVETSKTETLPANLFTKDKPADAISVAEARKLKAGSEVKVFGEVIGEKDLFVTGRASFIIGDPGKITVCQDACGAPWDCCCDDKKLRAASTLSVQVVDSKGQVIKEGLKNQNGLKELSKVVIEGKVDTSSTANFMIINANKIYVE